MTVLDNFHLPSSFFLLNIHNVHLSKFLPNLYIFLYKFLRFHAFYKIYYPNYNNPILSFLLLHFLPLHFSHLSQHHNLPQYLEKKDS